VDADIEPCGDVSTKLIIIRGNSGSGKSTVAAQVQRRAGRNCALVGQDHFRRIVLWEQDHPGGLVCDYLKFNVRFLLDRRRDVALEGILWTGKYGLMLRRLLTGHRGNNSVFYLDIGFEETLRRHATRPLAGEVSPDQIRDWYHAGDILGVPGEQVIGETSTCEQTIELIGTTAGLWQLDDLPDHGATKPQVSVDIR